MTKFPLCAQVNRTADIQKLLRKALRIQKASRMKRLLSLLIGIAAPISFVAEANSVGVNEIHESVIGKNVIARNAPALSHADKDTSSENPVLSNAKRNLVLKGQLIQGALVRGELPPKSTVWLNGKLLNILDSGSFVFGFGRDAKLSHKLEWQLSGNNKRFEEILILEKREYKVQHIEGVASKYVSPPKEVSARISLDNKQIGNARRIRSTLSAFSQTFILPAQGSISGVYGSRWVFNGEPKRPHFGLDIAGPVGTPIVSPVDGIVSLVHNDMYYSGGTLIIDHGLGVSSTFIHLSSIDVKKGDVVKQNQKIAEMGATGRVTGPHLDWRINWFSERLDPALLVDLSKAKNKNN